MNSSFSKILGVVVLCAVCAGSGYFVGSSGTQADASSAAAEAAAKTRTIVVNNAASAAGPASSGMNLDAFLHGTGKLNADTLAAWAKSISPEEANAALQALKGEPASARRNEIMGALYNSMAERDPKGFLAGADTIGVPRLREGGVDAALKAWAAQDPKAALQWIKDNPGTASTAANQQRFAAAIAGFAATDPQGALAAVNALGDGSLHERNLKSAAIKALADTITEMGNFPEAAKLFTDLPAGDTRQDAYSQLAQRWAETNPKEAADWVATLGSDPQLRSTMGVQVAKAWADVDPMAAAAWAAEMDKSGPPANPDAPNTLQGQLLASAIQSWANYDLEAPGKFLNELPPSPAKDGSVAIFALRASAEDPQSAMNWVGTITNDNMRNGATLVVSLQWMQQDQDGFKQFVQTTDKLDEQQKQMLNNFPPQAAQRLQQMTRMMGGENVMQNIMENAIINGDGMMGGRGGNPFGGRGGQGGPPPGGGQ